MAPPQSRYACPFASCKQVLRNKSGLTQHIHSVHTIPAHLHPDSSSLDALNDHALTEETISPDLNRCRTEYHPQLNGLSGHQTLYLTDFLQVSLVTKMGTFYLKVRLRLQAQHQAQH
jgi:hypothetical protein